MSTPLSNPLSTPRKTAIVTGASQGIGAGVVKAFVEHGFNVVANSRKMTQSAEIARLGSRRLVDGDIADPKTAARIVQTAVSRFNSIDALVNNAGIILSKPFTDYTTDDLKSVLSTNIEGFFHITQAVIKQMLVQKTGGSVVTITAALVRNPIRGTKASVSMITMAWRRSPGILRWNITDRGIRGSSLLRPVSSRRRCNGTCHWR